jgi:predicted KAP-like P-loop ATPase
MAKKADSKIEPDKALVSIDDDVLGVADLAKRLAASIARMTPHEGLVIGLYGKWGSGKTTFINFVKQALNEFKKEEKPLVLHFNPWLFAGHEDLIQRFLVELSKLLSPSEHETKKFRLKLWGKVEEIASVSEQLLVFASSLSGIPMMADSAKAVATLSQAAVKKLTDQEPLSEQKEKIEDLLRKKAQKILVIIDDIDRLEVNEVLDIFRMVKSVADFPNIIYLLSFDKERVSQVIQDSQGGDGASYLEKIVQFDVDIPYPDHMSMLKLFGGRIDPTLEISGGKPWDADRWSVFYSEYLREHIRTPRQAVRLSNAFRVSYPALRGEVDPVDFLAIESLRMFHTGIYYQIRSNPSKFTEFGSYGFDAEKEKGAEKEYFENLVNMAPASHRSSVYALLELLFPRFEKAFGSFESDSDVSELRANCRVSSEYHFGRYFSYSLLPNQFSDSEIQKAISVSNDLSKFEDLIVGFSKQIARQPVSRIPEFLERVLDFIKAGQAEDHLKDLIHSFIVLGDLIIREEDEERGFMTGISTDLRVLWIINNSLKRLKDQTEIFSMLKIALEQSKSVHVPVRLLYYLGREHGKYSEKKESIRPGQPPYVTLEQLADLEKIVLAKIEAAAANDSLLDHVEMLGILFRWRDITGSFDKPRAWVEKVAATDEGLKKILVGFGTITIRSGGKKTEHILNVRADYVESFLNLEQTKNRVQKLLKDGNLSDDETKSFNAFLKSLEKKKNGADPLDDDD